MRRISVGSLMDPGWGLITRQTKLVVRSLAFSALHCPLPPLPPPHLSRQWMEMEIELIIDHTYVKKPP